MTKRFFQQLMLPLLVIGSFNVQADPHPANVIKLFLGGQEQQPKVRINHAQGVCITGYFESNGDLARLSRAELFQPGVKTPVLGRFSIPGSMAVDETTVPVRGMALQFSLTNGEHWQTAMNNFPVFSVSTPDNFYRLQLAQQADPATGKPNPERLARFFEAHPESQAFREWSQNKVPPKSYASEAYNSVNAFVLESNRGERRAVRWTMRPQQTESSETESVSLQQDLEQRLQQGDLRWDFVFTFAEWGDPTNNATVAWPNNRAAISAGTLVIQQSQAQDDGACRDISFLPTSLPQGIGLSDDPLIYFRSTVYVEALSQRLAK